MIKRIMVKSGKKNQRPSVVLKREGNKTGKKE
jgi:hypothetical protein